MTFWVPNRLDPDQAWHLSAWSEIISRWQKSPLAGKVKLCSSTCMSEPVMIERKTYRHCNWFPSDLITSGFRSEKKNTCIVRFIMLKTIHNFLLEFGPTLYAERFFPQFQMKNSQSDQIHLDPRKFVSFLDTNWNVYQGRIHDSLIEIRSGMRI